MSENKFDPTPWYMQNIFSEEELERFAIMTVDGGMDDSLAEKLIRMQKMARIRAQKAHRNRKQALRRQER